MAGGLQDDYVDHMTLSPPDCMQFAIKMFSAPAVSVLPHDWDDKYMLSYFNILLPYSNTRGWRRLRLTRCLLCYFSWFKTETTEQASQPGRTLKEAPTGQERRGTMANIAVQRIKREFKEVLKSEEVGCDVFQWTVLLFLFVLRLCSRM